MTSEKTLPQTREQKADQELDRRYGAIGISAVAAAVRFHSGAKGRAESWERPTADEKRHGRAA